METLTRLILGLALLTALGLGLQMCRGKSGRGGLASPKGMSILRTLLVSFIMPLLLWQLVLPNTVPEELLVFMHSGLKLAGLGLFSAGALLRIWSQMVLGRQWSADLSLKGNHKLVRSGPYAWSRHPIYTSYFLIAPGLFLVTGNWLLGALVGGYIVVSALRVGEEEEMLRQHFGELYEAYARTTDRWLPASFVLAPVLLVNFCGMVLELSWLFYG